MAGRACSYEHVTCTDTSVLTDGITTLGGMRARKKATGSIHVRRSTRILCTMYQHFASRGVLDVLLPRSLGTQTPDPVILPASGLGTPRQTPCGRSIILFFFFFSPLASDCEAARMLAIDDSYSRRSICKMRVVGKDTRAGTEGDRVTWTAVGRRDGQNERGHCAYRHCPRGCALASSPVFCSLLSVVCRCCLLSVATLAIACCLDWTGPRL